VLRTEQGGIVTGWIFKLLISLALVGVVAFEAGAVIVARVTVDGVASEAAGEAASAYARGQNAGAAEAIAKEYAASHGATMVGFTIENQGRAVTVTVEKRARTILLHRIGATEKWTVARTTHRRPVVA
jgi:hypothetical protein